MQTGGMQAGGFKPTTFLQWGDSAPSMYYLKYTFSQNN